MYKMNTRPTQTRTPQLSQDIRKTNKRVSFSTGVITTTSVIRPQFKSTQLEDWVMQNNSQVKTKKVEDHRRNFKFSNNKTFVTACNDGLNAKTSNVNFVCGTCGKYGENLDKMKEKGDACIFVGYSTQSKGYIVYNKRTRLIVETIYVNFDELSQMALDHDSFDPAPQCQTMALEHNTLSPDPQSQYNVPTTDETYLAVTTADASDKRQQLNTTPSTSTTLAADITHWIFKQHLNLQLKHQLSLLLRTSIKKKMHRLTKTSSSTLLLHCRAKPKNIKGAMADHAWIEAIQEELHQFKQLDVGN
ncbi:hypothetical protein Tco_0754873 [Tanacetum coccineum]